MLHAEIFEKKYKRAPEFVSFCPYRICPLGAHVDHNFGKVTGFAIDKGIHISFSPSEDGIIEVSSVQFPETLRWSVFDSPLKKQNDWADYLRGITAFLSEKYEVHIGIRSVIEGTLPIGGLSSSAAVTLVFLSALCKVNGIKMAEKEMILTAQRAEREFVGVSVGKLDQSCEIYCKKDKLLYLDTLDDSYSLYSAPKDMNKYEIAVFFSGLEHSLVSSKYNMRVDELKSAAYALLAYAGYNYSNFKDTYMRSVPEETFEKYGHLLPETWRKRAEHWYGENRRVEKGIEAWQKGNIGLFGKLITESGHSSIYSWETGSDELKRLHEILSQTDGVYGGRFSGAGFKGCCIALTHPDFRERIQETVKAEYTKSFPSLSDKFSVCFCESANGISTQI